VPDPESIASAVDVGDPQVEEFAQSQSTAVRDPQHESVASGWDGIEQPPDIIGTKDDGERAWLFAVDDEGNEVGSVEDVSVKEAQCGCDLVEQAPGCGLCDEVELEVAELVGCELFGRAVEVFGSACDGRDVGLDSSW
jgi:hypothetical protein